MKKNDEFELSIIDISEEGLGIGKKDSFVWFVKDTVPGDKILAKCTRLKVNYGFARLVKMLVPSSYRVDPPCPVASACGGCQIQQLDYRYQLEFKEKKVLNALKRIGGLDDPFIEPIVGTDKPFRYRNKAVYPFGTDSHGSTKVGFYAARTHDIIETKDCLIGSEKNKLIIETIIRFMMENHLSPYDEKKGQGFLRHVLIRESYAHGSIMVSLIINAQDFKKKDALRLALRQAVPDIKSISLNLNRTRDNVISGRKLINIYGPGYIEDVIADVKYRISPLSFFQVNPAMTEKLYETVLEFADLRGNEIVWDLYCGVGTISLLLAKRAAKVYGVEIVSQAVDDAWENAAINGVENAVFMCGKAEEILSEWDVSGVDVLVADPPRKGSSEKCLEAILKISPKRIIYVSCNPSTMARDLRYLVKNGYHLVRVRPFDMFPQTVSVEVVALLARQF